MKPEQERVQNLLKDTVTTLCRNSLLYNRGIKVQGLLGITLDEDDVFLVHFNEIFQGFGSQEVTIQPADSVSRGLDVLRAIDTDTDADSCEGLEVYQQRLNPVPHRKTSRRKAQPSRAPGGLSDVSPAKRASYDKPPSTLAPPPSQLDGGKPHHLMSIVEDLNNNSSNNNNTHSVNNNNNNNTHSINNNNNNNSSSNGNNSDDTLPSDATFPASYSINLGVTPARLSACDDENDDEDDDGCGAMSEGDVDIMKQSYMMSSDLDRSTASSAAPDDLTTFHADGATTDKKHPVDLLGDSTRRNDDGDSSTGPTPEEPDFIQGGPFISGVAQSFATPQSVEMSGPPSSTPQRFQYNTLPDGLTPVARLAEPHIIHVIEPESTAATESWQQPEVYPVNLAKMEDRRIKRPFPTCQRPRHNLGSKQQKDALRRHLVVPLVRDFTFNVVPLRVIWRINDERALEDTWGRILELRQECDRVVSGISGVAFFISSITGAFSKPHRGRYQNVTVYPAVSYWIICNGSSASAALSSPTTSTSTMSGVSEVKPEVAVGGFEGESGMTGGLPDIMYMSRTILMRLGNHHVTVKPINIPMTFQRSGVHSRCLNAIDLLSSPLFVVMKDHTNHFTVNKVAHSATVCGQRHYAVARIVAVNTERFLTFLERAALKLRHLLPGLTVVSMPHNDEGSQSVSSTHTTCS